MVGRLVVLLDSLFSSAMLVLGRVHFVTCLTFKRDVTLPCCENIFQLDLFFCAQKTKGIQETSKTSEEQNEKLGIGAISERRCDSCYMSSICSIRGSGFILPFLFFMIKIT